MDAKSWGRGETLPRMVLFAALVIVALAFLLVPLALPAAGALDAALKLGSLGLLVLAATVYLLAPLFSAHQRAKAREAYGTHRDVLANLIAAVVWGSFVFLPLLLIVLAVAEHWQAGPLAVLSAAFGRVQQLGPLLVFLALVGLDIAIFLVIYLRLLRTGATTARDLGCTGVRFSQNLKLGAVGWLGILAVSLAFGQLFSQLGWRSAQAQQLELGAATPDIFWLIFLAGAVLAPLAEESFFRGYVFHSYLVDKGPLWAYAISTLVFAVLHLSPTTSLGSNLALFLPVCVMAFILAGLFQRSGSLVPNVVAHALNNAFGLLFLYYFPGGA